jgi:hypothetical protein
MSRITDTLREDTYGNIRPNSYKLQRKSEHIFRSIILFPKIVLFFLDNVEKYIRVGQAIDDSIVYALCILHNQGYRHTLRIRNALFHVNNGYANVRHCYVMRIVPVYYLYTVM